MIKIVCITAGGLPDVAYFCHVIDVFISTCMCVSDKL